ncbi:MAG: glycogen debranching enzyme GlgX, partial [Rhodospirillaceae bacterium]
LAGSSNRFQGSGRRPSASVNFVTCHDGFTLADLTAYGQKHNHANGEDNRDGSDHEGSRNFGHEGPVESSHPDRREIEARRLRARRALLGSLFLSLGVPMLCAGDEIGRSQHGNNNAYCQDSPLSWIDWSAADQDLLRFCRSCIDLRRRLDQFQRDRWLSPETDVLWRAPDGALLEGEAWGHARGAFAMQLRGNGDGPDVLVLMNAREESVDFTLPDGQAWECVLSADPARPTPSPSGRRSLPATDLKVFLSVG